MKKLCARTPIGHCHWGLIGLLIVAILLPACGRKTMPKPIAMEPPPPIQELSTRVVGKEVEVSWSMEELSQKAMQQEKQEISILRTDIRWEDRNCADCPVHGGREVFRLDPAFPRGAEMRAGRAYWKDTSVLPSRAYRYQAMLIDAGSRVLMQSNTTLVRMVPSPASPRDLSAAGSPQGIMLQWKEIRRDADGKPLLGEVQYLVERTFQQNQWETLSPVPVSGNSFLDSAPAPNQVYRYRVTPVMSFEGAVVYGESILLSGVKAPEELPPPPPGKVWGIPSKGKLEIQWTAVDGNHGGYHVYRREGSEIIRLTATPIKSPPFHDGNVKPNVVYGYAVSTVSQPPNQKEGLLSKWVEMRSVSF